MRIYSYSIFLELIMRYAPYHISAIRTKPILNANDEIWLPASANAAAKITIIIAIESRTPSVITDAIIAISLPSFFFLSIYSI